MADNISEPISKPLIIPLSGKASYFITYIVSVTAFLMAFFVTQKYSFRPLRALQSTSIESLDSRNLIHRPLNQLVDTKGKLNPAFLKLCQLTGMELDTSVSLETVVQKTQQNWLRQPGTERHELTEGIYEAKWEELLPLLQTLNVMDTIEAKQTHQPYHTVLLHCAMADTVKNRIQFLIAEYQRGVRFKQVVLLTGDRPLHSKKEAKYIKLGLNTEAEMVHYLWETMPGLPQPLKNKVHLIIAKGTVIHGHYKRPTTRDTIHQWLDEVSPRLDHRYLAISNQPFVTFQDFVFYNTLRERVGVLYLETIGGASSCKKPIMLHLDNLSRCLYELVLSRTLKTVA